MSVARGTVRASRSAAKAIGDISPQEMCRRSTKKIRWNRPPGTGEEQLGRRTVHAFDNGKGTRAGGGEFAYQRESLHLDPILVGFFSRLSDDLSPIEFKPGMDLCVQPFLRGKDSQQREC